MANPCIFVIDNSTRIHDVILVLSIFATDTLFDHFPYVTNIYEFYDLFLNVLCTNVDEMQVAVDKLIRG